MASSYLPCVFRKKENQGDTRISIVKTRKSIRKKPIKKSNRNGENQMNWIGIGIKCIDITRYVKPGKG